MGFKMYVPTKIYFGVGCLDELSKVEMPGKKAMIIISNGKSTRDNGYLERTEQALKEAGVLSAVFDGIEPNPTKGSVMRGGAFARENNCDFIVALGGGSVMDAAKAIATVATNDGDLWDYVGGKTGKRMPVKNEPLKIIAITTTAGTGSEVDAWGVITNPETKEKIGVGGLDSHFPVTAIVDPELMKSVPPKFTAYQGFDALFHSTECYISGAANLMSDMYALTAIENIAKYLPTACRDGNNIEARERVAFANTLSGVVMTLSSTTSEHSMEHAMSAYHPELPHGAGLIMISIEYYRHFIGCHACDDRFIKMAQVMGIENATKPEDFLTALQKLQEDCFVADLKMSDYGIKKDECMTLAINAKETMGGLFAADRVPLNNEDCAKIYERSYR